MWPFSLFTKKQTSKNTMPPQVLQLGLFVLEEAIKQTPALISEFQALFASGQPTAQDFAALRAKVAGESYASLVPSSAIPANVVPIPATTAAPVPTETAAPAVTVAPAGWTHPAN